MKYAIVNSKELGTNCWSAVRFTGGARCHRWDDCTYPEKKTCKAREAEIEYLKVQKTIHENLSNAFQDKIEKLERG